MKTTKKWIAFLLLLAGLVLLNVTASLLPVKADLTEDNLYTLSKGTRALLAKIEEPVRLKFYFSRGLEDLPIMFKNYATRVEELLRQYVAASKGRVILDVIDPKPDTKEEEAAVRYGVAGNSLPGGGRLFFGLAALQAEREEIIPFFSLQREEFLELDISQLIYRVRQFSLPKAGVLSSLPVIRESADFMAGPEEEDWSFADELRNNFEVEPIQPADEEIPSDTDVLMVIHPQNFSDRMLYEIDQFLLSGKPVFIAVDPSCNIQKRHMSQQQMMQSLQGSGPELSSDLPRLFKKWGINYDPAKVAADINYATNVSTGPGGGAAMMPVWLSVTGFDGETSATANLEQMLFPEPGSFSVQEDEDLEFTELISTTRDSDEVDARILMYSRPEEVARQVAPTGKKRVLGGIITGKFRTAFPRGKPKAESGEGKKPEPAEDEDSTLKESKDVSTLVLVADVDFMADPFSVRVINFFGRKARSPLNDNLAFVSNIMDFIGGSQDLISLRSKGSAFRPFKKVQEIEKEAQRKYQEKLEELDEKLREVQNQLREYQNQQRDQGRLVASPEVRQAIQKYRQEEARMRAERREIRKKLREDIERLELRLALFNLLAFPALVGAFGIGFFIIRTKRQRG